MDSHTRPIALSGRWQHSIGRVSEKHMGIVLRNGFLALALATCAHTQTRAELRFAVHTDPKTFDPLLATEEVSEMIRYLTGGVLIRFNRHTQQPEPELATSWKVFDQGKRIDFVLRRNVSFSDGTPFTAASNVACASFESSRLTS